MSDIFREVDEAMQREKLEKLWHEYKSTIIAAIAILIVGTAGMTAYRNWDAARDAAETERLLQALDSQNPETALQQAIKDTRAGHEALGLLTKAGFLLEEGKQQEAAAIYRQLAEDRSAPKDLRNLSRILYSQNSEENTMEILQPLLVDEKSPWIWHARLQAAVITAHQQNDYNKAIEYLQPFDTVERIPLSLKQRAQALKHIYGLRQAAAPQITEETTSQNN
jgi:hypothetical protein